MGNILFVAGLTVGNLTEEERDAVWDEISDEVSALLQGQRELPDSAMPFDAASTVTIEQQRYVCPPSFCGSDFL